MSDGDDRSAGDRHGAGAPADAALPRALRRRPPSRWRRLAIIGAGSFLVLVGMLGIVLPILPGWLLIGAGLVVLSQEVRSARRLLEWLRCHYPSIVPSMPAVENRFRWIFSRLCGRP